MRSFTFCVISIALAIAVSSVSAQSPEHHTLTGIVRDGSGARIPSALIIVATRDSSFTRLVSAGRDGTFAVSPLAAGEYLVTVTAAGFGPQTVTARVPAAPALELTLEPAPVIEQVRVVSADRQEELRHQLNTRVDVISAARMENTGAETVGDVLSELPGVLTRRGSEGAGPAGEQIQGLDSRQVLVLLDGQPIPSARGIKRGVVNLDRQSTARLDRVEVVKGAASATYGSDAIGGVINLITRDVAAPLEMDGALSAGSFGDLDARVGAGLRRGGWTGLFIGERHQGDGFDLTPSTYDTTAAPFRRTDGMAKVSGRLGADLGLSGLATGYANHTTGRSNGELGPQADDIRDDTFSVGVNADWLLRPTMTVQGRAYVSRYDERSSARLAPPASSPLEPGSLDEDVAKLDATMSALLGGRHHVQGGVEYTDNRYAGANRIAFDDGVSASTVVGWAQHRMSLGDRVTTTVGARVDRHSQFGTALSPKVAANVRVMDGLHARVSYGGGFRAPDLGQLYYRFINPSSIYQVIGNPNLEPEHARSLQAGADWQSRSRRARLGVNFFHNDVTDLIESVSLGVVMTPGQLAALLEREGLDPSFRPVLGRLLFTYKNVNEAVTRGGELDGEVAVTPQLSVGGAYTYLQAVDTRTNRDLSGRHEHQGHARVSWHSDEIGLRANLRATAYSSWIAAQTATSNTIAPGFTLWDVYASQRLVGGLTAFATVENLFDNQDPNTGVLTASGAPATIYRPEAGRTIRAGLRWRWSK